MRTTASDATDGTHAVLAVGLVANATTEAVAVAETADGLLLEALALTGPLDPALALTIEADDASLEGGYVLVPMVDGGRLADDPR